MGRKLVKDTIYLSLQAQFITTLVGLIGLFVHLTDKHIILRSILALETFVQVIEGTFYAVMMKYFQNIETPLLSPIRYGDWLITTPTMLLTTVAFMDYNNKKNTSETTGIFKFIKENKSTLKQIVLYNFLMLVCGLLAEFKIIPVIPAVMIGFIFFGLTFNTIRVNYVKKSRKNRNIFIFIVLVWGLYGFAALLGNIKKNVAYNSLDVVAKNFYGLYIFYEILKVSSIN